LWWRSKNEIDDGLAYRRQAWLRRRSVDSFFPPHLREATVLQEGVGDHGHQRVAMKTSPGSVPQLFVATGATKWNDPKDFPWTTGFQPNYQSEAQIYFLENYPDAKIGVMYQNDDYGKDYLRGLKDGLGSKADSMIIATESYETSEPTIDSHIVNLKASGANVFFDVAIPKFAAQAIREVADLKWKPVHFLNNVSASISATIKPAGVENSQGIVSSIWLKDPTDPQWKDDPDIKAWNAFLDKYYPEANRSDGNVIYGYAVAQAVVHVLGQCGDNLTRENIMKQAASLRDYTVAGLLPGIKINTSATDFAPVSQMQLMQFKGDTWERFGKILRGKVGS
jgi:branched-chain amino acid transport system substrate-binding protein